MIRRERRQEPEVPTTAIGAAVEDKGSAPNAYKDRKTAPPDSRDGTDTYGPGAGPGEDPEKPQNLSNGSGKLPPDPPDEDPSGESPDDFWKTFKQGLTQQLPSAVISLVLAASLTVVIDLHKKEDQDGWVLYVDRVVRAEVAPNPLI